MKKFIIGYIAGVLSGCFAALAYTKHKNNVEKANNLSNTFDPNAVAEYCDNDVTATDSTRKHFEPEDFEDYDNIIKNNGYSSVTTEVPEEYSADEEEERVNGIVVQSIPEPEDHFDGPVVISFDEFMNLIEQNDYSRGDLSWFPNPGILTDDHNVPVDDPEGTVGEFVSYFGEDEEEPWSVHVRNDKLHSVYEIIWDDRDYAMAKRIDGYV